MDIDERCVKSGNYHTLKLVTPIAQNDIKQRAVEVVSGGIISSETGVSTMTSEGYYNGSDYDTSDNVIISSEEAEGYYKVTVGSQTIITRSPVTRQITTAGYLDEESEPVEKIPEEIVESDAEDAPYFIKKSTISATTITPNENIQVVSISNGYFPTDRSVTVNPIAQSSPVTSVTSTGMANYFYSANISDYDISITPKYTNAPGFVVEHTNANNGGIEYYKIKNTEVNKGKTIYDGISVNRGVASWNAGWITAGEINPASFKNTPTTGKNYVDISNTTESPVLISGDYLYIDSGYVDDLKISLAKLVPDGASVYIGAGHILNGYSAYDGDGHLITGTIQTYDGSYTLA